MRPPPRRQVLAVLNLLSSVALYNNLNTIDRSSIEKLSFAVETGPCLPLWSPALGFGAVWPTALLDHRHS
jgi:hypothetical protein